MSQNGPIGDIRHVENEAVLLENRDIGGFKCGSFVGNSVEKVGFGGGHVVS
jgi:hypothetical protein